MINKNYKDKVALVTKGKSFTYQEMFQKINQYSELFFKDKAYTKIAIHAENRAEWVFAFYAAWKNNCTVVPIDFLASVDDVSYILNDCKPELVFLSKETLTKVDPIKENLEYTPQFTNLDQIELTESDSDFSWEGPDDIEKTAVIIYTSGTTGSPKGVMLSYKNLLANVKGVSEDVKIYTQDRQVLMLLPLHHIFPLTGSMIAPLSVGGTSVMSPSMQSADILETLRNNKVNIMIGVPRLYDLLYKSLKAKVFASFIGRVFYTIVKGIGSQKLAKKIFKKVHDGFGGHLEYLVSGGAALNKETGTFFQTIGFDVLEGYGMTEAAPMITFTRPGTGIIGSPGQALPGLSMEIRDDEIVAKGDNIMKGYYNRPEETADVLKDGWLYTGDLGRVDKNGFLFITGRKKEIIVLQNGKNINPVELEVKLESYDCVKEAGVFQRNDKLHALIVPDYEVLANAEVNDPEIYFKKEIIPGLNQRLTSYKRIMKFLLIKEELPRTRLGKIQRFKLNEIFEHPRAQEKVIDDQHIPVSEEYQVIKTYIESQVDMTISPEDHIEFDIAMDSLGKITLIEFIERTFGVKIEEDKLMK
ncbi:MAG: non-ribosomal peptide synthetase, partial [Bacteroidota bacterium]